MLEAGDSTLEPRHMTTTGGPRPLTLTARSTEDLLAVVPVVLGFVPAESVVMLTFGAPRTFHARVDLPADACDDDLDLLVRTLVDPASRHLVTHVALVAFTADRTLARRVGRRLLRTFERHGIGVIDVVRADSGRWWPACGRRAGVPEVGVPYDVGSHPFVAASVLDGRVVLPSRQQVAAMLDPLAPAVEAVRAAIGAPHGAPDDASDHEGDDDCEGWWVGELVQTHADAATVPPPEHTARLLLALQRTEVRDLVWMLTPTTGTVRQAREWVSFWTEVVRRTPPGLVAPPAALLAFAAWNAGEGALAWCAIDVAESDDEAYTMTALVARLLTEAVPPGSLAH